jgi:hypothetical protein
MRNWIFALILVLMPSVVVTSVMTYCNNHETFSIKGAPNLEYFEYKELKEIGKGFLQTVSASKACKKYSDVFPYELREPYLLYYIEPDMKNCITDPAFMVIKKEGQDYTLVFFGTCCFEGTPWE